MAYEVKQNILIYIWVPQTKNSISPFFLIFEKTCFLFSTQKDEMIDILHFFFWLILFFVWGTHLTNAKACVCVCVIVAQKTISLIVPLQSLHTATFLQSIHFCTRIDLFEILTTVATVSHTHTHTHIESLFGWLWMWQPAKTFMIAKPCW